MTTIRLLAVETPRVLPDFVACYSAQLVEGDRSLHFAAGRECVARAMTQLGAGPPVKVPRGVAGEPIWPERLTGSITHKDDLFSAAVAWKADALSVGIDTEQIIEADRADRIARHVVLAQEAGVGGEPVGHGLRVSLLFSIKEAVYKCLYPLVQKRFYYDALAVAALDLTSATFQAELTVALSPDFPAGRLLEGRFVVDAVRVHTGIWLPPGP